MSKLSSIMHVRYAMKKGICPHAKQDSGHPKMEITLCNLSLA